MAEIKMYVADTIDLVQKWVNENNLDYDSIKLQCYSCDNSTSGVVFTVYGREGNQFNSKNANSVVFDVNKVLIAFFKWREGKQLTADMVNEIETFVKEYQGDLTN